MRIIGPCKVGDIECPNRSLSCKKECLYYRKYQDEVAAQREALRKDKEDSHTYWEIRNKNTMYAKRGRPVYHAH